jgi:hypothetical protein
MSLIKKKRTSTARSEAFAEAAKRLKLKGPPRWLALP